MRNLLSTVTLFFTILGGLVSGQNNLNGDQTPLGQEPFQDYTPQNPNSNRNAAFGSNQNVQASANADVASPRQQPPNRPSGAQLVNNPPRRPQFRRGRPTGPDGLRRVRPRIFAGGTRNPRARPLIRRLRTTTSFPIVKDNVPEDVPNDYPGYKYPKGFFDDMEAGLGEAITPKNEVPPDVPNDYPGFHYPKGFFNDMEDGLDSAIPKNKRRRFSNRTLVGSPMRFGGFQRRRMRHPFLRNIGSTNERVKHPIIRKEQESPLEQYLYTNKTTTPQSVRFSWTPAEFLTAMNTLKHHEISRTTPPLFTQGRFIAGPGAVRPNRPNHSIVRTVRRKIRPRTFTNGTVWYNRTRYPVRRRIINRRLIHRLHPRKRTLIRKHRKHHPLRTKIKKTSMPDYSFSRYNSKSSGPSDVETTKSYFPLADPSIDRNDSLIDSENPDAMSTKDDVTTLTDFAFSNSPTAKTIIQKHPRKRKHPSKTKTKKSSITDSFPRSNSKSSEINKELNNNIEDVLNYDTKHFLNWLNSLLDQEPKQLISSTSNEGVAQTTPFTNTGYPYDELLLEEGDENKGVTTNADITLTSEISSADMKAQTTTSNAPELFVTTVKERTQISTSIVEDKTKPPEKDFETSTVPSPTVASTVTEPTAVFQKEKGTTFVNDLTGATISDNQPTETTPPSLETTTFFTTLSLETTTEKQPPTIVSTSEPTITTLEPQITSTKLLFSENPTDIETTTISAETTTISAETTTNEIDITTTTKEPNSLGLISTTPTPLAETSMNEISLTDASLTEAPTKFESDATIETTTESTTPFPTTLNYEGSSTLNLEVEETTQPDIVEEKSTPQTPRENSTPSPEDGVTSTKGSVANQETLAPVSETTVSTVEDQDSTITSPVDEITTNTEQEKETRFEVTTTVAAEAMNSRFEGYTTNTSYRWIVPPPEGEKCGLNESYYGCAPNCRHTCFNYDSFDVPCPTPESCMAGCFCNPGMVIDENGRCVDPEDCFEVQCDIDEEWWDCMPTCHNTCENYARASACTDKECTSGCFCREGLLKDMTDGTCRYPEECEIPVCEENEEETDCVSHCNTCAANCHTCRFSECRAGCDCRDGYKRGHDGSCIHASLCPLCTSPATSNATTPVTLSTTVTPSLDVRRKK